MSFWMLLKCHHIKGEEAQKSASFSKIMTSYAAFLLSFFCWNFVDLFVCSTQEVKVFDLNSQRVITNIKREPGKYVTLINFADKISSTNLKVVVSTWVGRLCIALLQYMFQLLKFCSSDNFLGEEFIAKHAIFKLKYV